MKKLKISLFPFLTAALFAIIITSCAKDQLVIEPTPAKQPSLLFSPNNQATTERANNGNNKVDLCHYSQDDQTWHVISVNQNAVPAHLAHGDVVLVDADGDGWVDALNECVPGGDCNDADPNINPGATEVCDGVDNNCDGNVDEGFDQDGDNYTTCAGDCDDTDPAINPGAAEICGNGIDDDCDGEVDEDCISFTGCWGDIPYLSDPANWTDVYNFSACNPQDGFRVMMCNGSVNYTFEWRQFQNTPLFCRYNIGNGWVTSYGTDAEFQAGKAALIEIFQQQGLDYSGCPGYPVCN